MPNNLLRASAAAIPIAAAFLLSPAIAQAQEQGVWNGWYVGGNIGGAWGDNSQKATVSPGSGAVVIPPADVAVINSGSASSSNKSGFTGGIEGGYDYRMGDWLLGLETDFVALDLNQRQSNTFQSPIVTPGLQPATYTLSQRAKTNWMWSVRPRVGYVAGPWLVYATGGLAVTDVKATVDFSDNRTPANVVRSEKSSTKTGWIAGLGAGYAITPQWSLKGEWLYSDFGSISTTATSAAGFVNLTSDTKVRSNIFRVGADYRF